MFALPSKPGLADRFGLIIGGLCRAVAKRGAAERGIQPLVVLLFSYLQRMARRFAVLAARAPAAGAPAGKLPPPRLRPTIPPTPPRPREKDRLPQGFAWLVRLVGSEAACCGSQLQHLLTDPEMAALLQAAPQVGRMLRPLCRMLGQTPDPAILPPPPERPAATPTEPARTRPPRTPKPGGAPDTPEPKIVWRRWRGILMPEVVRPPEPA